MAEIARPLDATASASTVSYYTLAILTLICTKLFFADSSFLVTGVLD